MCLISVQEAAAMMGISRSLAYEMARTGHLPVIRLRNLRSIRVHRDKLQAMIDAEAAASIRSAGGVKEESPCPTKEATHLSGGSATSYQLENTLDALLGQKTTRRQRH